MRRLLLGHTCELVDFSVDAAAGVDVGGAARGGGTGATGRAAALAGLSRDRGRSRRRSGESSLSRRRLSPRSLDFDLRRRGDRDLLLLLGIL